MVILNVGERRLREASVRRIDRLGGKKSSLENKTLYKVKKKKKKGL